MISKEKRSQNMALIKSKDTKPEMIVRRLLYKHGYRYRLHQRGLIGKPDIVFSGKKKAVFVHGCFWHRHPNCRFAYNPKSRKEFWQRKFRSNMRRDKQVQHGLQEEGWEIIVIWECETKVPETLFGKLQKFLGDP